MNNIILEGGGRRKRFETTKFNNMNQVRKNSDRSYQVGKDRPTTPNK